MDKTQQELDANQVLSDLRTQVRDLSSALYSINVIAGNLSDDRVMAIGGVNGGTDRAIMVVGARELAYNALIRSGFTVDDHSKGYWGGK